MRRIKSKSSKRTTSNSRELIDRFRKDCSIRGMTPESIVRYVSTIRIFCKYLAKKKHGLIEVDKDILRDFIEHLRLERGISQKTLENYFTEISCFYEFLAYEELIDSNPVTTVRKRYLRRYKSNGGNEEHTHNLISDDVPPTSTIPHAVGRI